MNPFVNSPERHRWLLLLLCLMLYVTAWYFKSARYDDRPSALVGFGCLSPEICFAAQNRAVMPDAAAVYRTGGYDGQFFYYIAADLYSDQRAVVDDTEFRWSRIGYPFLTGWAFLFGADALMWNMSLLLLFSHLLTVYFLTKSGLFADDPWPARILAFNPFSLFCFLLNVADGLALNFAVCGLLLHEMKGGEHSWRRLAGMQFCFMFALLTKETFLALPLGFMGVAALKFVFIKENRSFQKTLRSGLYWLLSLLPLLAWWWRVGFTPLLASKRGGPPLEGMLLYALEHDLIGSGRIFLVLLFLIYLLLAIFCLRFFARDAVAGALALSLLALTTVISFATADEYWGNFANICRMFTPGMVALVFLPPRLVQKPLARRIFYLLIAFLLIFTLSILKRELMGDPLPTVGVW